MLPPVVTIMPTDATVLPGGTVTFTATAISQINSTEFTFQWFEFPRNLSAFRLNDSETVSGSNTFTLTVRGVNERRIFAVQVTDGEGGISVDSVAVTVQLGKGIVYSFVCVHRSKRVPSCCICYMSLHTCTYM